jgi:biotin synthase-like enzyme
VQVSGLMPIEGTVLGNIPKGAPSTRIDDSEFVRTVAVIWDSWLR